LEVQPEIACLIQLTEKLAPLVRLEILPKESWAKIWCILFDSLVMQLSITEWYQGGLDLYISFVPNLSWLKLETESVRDGCWTWGGFVIAEEAGCVVSGSHDTLLLDFFSRTSAL
jgi:hypothetical protein